MFEIKNLTVAYEEQNIIHGLNTFLPPNKIIAIIGPNGCGKSTLLKVLTRNKKIEEGQILLNQKDISHYKVKALAKEITFLPQHKTAPEDIKVKDLVAYGRYPHLGRMKRFSKKDEDIVTWALEKTNLIGFRERPMSQLSGGESQRVWLAMALAQQSRILILDEPTTYLDMKYQLELLELVKELNREQGLSVIMVLHDINQAARYADFIVMMRDGEIIEVGETNQVMTLENIEKVFALKSQRIWDNKNNCSHFVFELEDKKHKNNRLEGDMT